ncbi:hypothetical protein BTVI_100427 [Pitangus sulphuratus]|nr:hypothetical protein BTVI_100427 [Pitangus sulphuratus]
MLPPRWDHTDFYPITQSTPHSKKSEKMSENLTSSKTTLKGPKASAKKQKGGNKAKESSKGKGKQLGEKDEADLSMASIGHPEIFPLAMTTKTQDIFNCRVDEDVTEENCFKIIKKEDIIQDLETRANISDFYPVRKVVLEYPGEELLIVFDAKFQYGQNFYIVASEEAKENLVKPPETAEEEKEEDIEEIVDPFKPLVPRPWVSLGSEKEVEEESVKDNVTKIKFKISRVRRKFGAPTAFTDKNASHGTDGYVECTSYEDKTFSIKMLEKDVGLQIVPKVREASTQTKWTYPKNAATQYCPRQLSEEEKAESLSSEKLKEFLTSIHLRLYCGIFLNMEEKCKMKNLLLMKALTQTARRQQRQKWQLRNMDSGIKGTFGKFADDDTNLCGAVNMLEEGDGTSRGTLMGLTGGPIQTSGSSTKGSAPSPTPRLWQPQTNLQVGQRKKSSLEEKKIAVEEDNKEDKQKRDLRAEEKLISGCMCACGGKVKSLSAVKAPAKESPYTEMSSSSSKNLEVLENISTNFFVGNKHANVLDFFEREVKYLKYCEQEFQEYQKFQAKTELKWSWRHRERKQEESLVSSSAGGYSVSIARSDTM